MTYSCAICGGRVVSLTSDEYRCEAEGVRWDMTETSLVEFGYGDAGVRA